MAKKNSASKYHAANVSALIGAMSPTKPVKGMSGFYGNDGRQLTNDEYKAIMSDPSTWSAASTPIAPGLSFKPPTVKPSDQVAMILAAHNPSSPSSMFGSASGDRVPSFVKDGGVGAFNAPSVYNPTSGVTPSAAQPTIDDLLKMLPGVNRSSYVAPYDAAATAAHATYDAAVPALNGMFGDLQSRLGSSGADEQAQMAAQRAALDQRLTADNAVMGDQRSALVDSLKKQGVDVAQLLGQADAGGLARQEAFKANGDAQLGLQDRFAQVAKQSMDSRLSDSQAQKTDALAAASGTLQQLLGQIGLGKATAERQYANDASSRAMSEFQLRQNAAAGQQKMDLEQLKAQDKHTAEISKMADKLATTPRQEFEKNFSQIATQYPVASTAFMDLVKKAGNKGPMAMAKALHLIDAGAAALADGSLYGKKLDVDTLKQWVQAYYDESSKSLSDDAKAQLMRVSGGVL